MTGRKGCAMARATVEACRMTVTSSGVTPTSARRRSRRASSCSRTRAASRASRSPWRARKLSDRVSVQAIARHSIGSDEAPEGLHELAGHLVAPLRVVASGRHAVLDVALGEAEGDLVECGLDRGDLLQDVGAPAVVVDHGLQAAYLPLDAPQACLQLVLRRGIAALRRRLGLGGCHGMNCTGVADTPGMYILRAPRILPLGIRRRR